MNDLDKLNLIAGALELGFIDLGNDEFKCTKEQLCQLCSIVAATAIGQSEEQINAQS